MHGYSSGSTIVVNAEVDSMGGVVESGVGIGLKTSPRQAAIEKAQAELRQEYDIREERRRELDFLENGGNPLDFRIGNATSVSVQSTSVTDQHLDQFVTSEAKVSFAFTASPHGDSVDSSGRLRAPSVCEPNSADNLLLFDADNELPEGERNSRRPTSKNNITQSEQSSQLEGSQNAKETEDSAIFRPYARRNRSKTNRDGARSSSTDVVHGRGGSKDSTGLILKINNHQDKNILSDSNRKSVSSNGNMVLRFMTSDDQAGLDLNDVRASKASPCTIEGSQPETKLDNSASKYSRADQQNQSFHPPQASTANACEQPHCVGVKEQLTPVDDTPLPLGTINKESETSFLQSNGVHDVKGRSRLTNRGLNGNVTVGVKGLELECSGTHNSLDLDVNIDSELYTNRRNVDSIGSATVHLGFQLKQDPDEGGTGNEKDEIKACSSSHLVNDDYKSAYQNHSAKGSIIKGETAIQVKECHSNEVKCNYPIEGVEYNESRVDRKVDGVLGDNCNSQENLCTVRVHSLSCSCNNELRGTTKPVTDPFSACDSHLSPGSDLALADKAREEFILEEARMIQAKHKRIAELSIHALPLENRRKSHWDFVIEEISWLANDFAQERIWKVTAAAQLCQQLAFTSRLRFEQQKKIWKLKEVAHTLAKAVMKFWYSAEELLGTDDSGSFPGNNEHDLVGTGKDDENELLKNRIRDPIMESRKELEPQYSGSFSLAVQKYAARFLKYNCTITSSHAEGPKTPDRLLDPSVLESSGVDQLKEILFYKIPLGAMDIYRKSIETHLMRLEKLSNSVQEEVDTSMYDDIADSEFGYQDNSYFEDDEDTTMSMHYGVLEGGKPSKVLHKRRKNPMKSFTGRQYEISDFSYGYCANGSQLPTLNGKRPASLNAGSIPTKRTRTASRQRILSPFNSSTGGIMHTQAKTDASSGDTSSFQDDHSTLHGPSQIQKSVEIESIGDFDKQIAYESVETSVKHKKKKKPKHLGSTYDHGWQLDSAAFGEQRDNSKRRLENHNFESNGMSGLYVQSNMKKPKMIKQSLDNTFASNPMAGSIPSPAASQMSNMSNTNRFMKLIGGRDRGRRAKALKMSVGNSGAGTPWSLFEDQALVVLVHDMGPNWELVSDAINSTLQLKCIFRKPKECKERHKILMDKSAGDGADSGEDSGTSQPYPSTLPGIPKGSARQLFQRLQEPMEEDTLKSHFEKIIKIGQKQYYRRSQNDYREAKQIAPVHNSHFIALSQVCPNYLNGVVLTPLDLCDASNPDAHSLGHQSSHASGISVSNHGAAATILPSSGVNSPLQGSSAIALGSNVSSFSGSVNTSIRDGRLGTQRMTSLPADDQKRIQQYNQMLSGRSFQQSNLSGAGNIPGSERSAKVLPGGNSPGLMGGMNRNMPVSRPGFQGMASSPMLNSASMVSSSVIGMPSPVNIHPSPTQGNPMLRPHDGLHMARPGHNLEHQRPMMIPELQIQATQGTSQGVQAFNGLSSTFANQTTPPSHTYSGHQQQHQMSPQSNHTTISSPNHPHLQAANHSAGSPQHAYPIRFPKERQLQQQRYLQQPQQQQQQLFTSASNSLMTQSQPPVSSSLQNSPQIQQQTLSHPTPGSSPATPMLSQQQQKHQLASPGLSRNPSIGSNNQLGKQRHRQSQQQHQFQQPNRHHPQQRPQTQSQHPAKLLKGVGRGNMMVHQSLALDPSHLNSLTMPSGNQASEKGEQMMQLVQGQSFFPGSGLNASQPSKPSVLQPSTHSQLHSKLTAGSAPPTSKQVQQMPSYSDNSSQTQVPQVSSGPTMAASHQARPSAVMISNHQQPQLQPQPSQKQLHQMQPSAQRMLQQNQQGISDQLTNCQTDQQPVNKTAQLITIATIPHSCADSESTVPVVSNWKSSELTGNSTIPSSSQLCGSIGSPPLTNPAGSELPPFTQASCLKQSLGGLTKQGLNVGSQFPQQTLLQTSPTQPQTSQKLEQVKEHQSPQHHLHLQQQSQQQSQHLQRG